MQSVKEKSKDLCLVQNAKVAIYGTGSEASYISNLINHLRPDVQILFYIDSFNEGIFNNKKLIKVTDLNNVIEDYDLIIIASAFYKEIEQNLINIGKTNYLISKTNLNLEKHVEIPKDIRSKAHKMNTDANYIKYDCCPICHGKNSVKTEFEEILKCPDCGHTYVEYTPDLNSTIKKTYSSIKYWYQDKVFQNIHKITESNEWDNYIGGRMAELNEIKFLDGLDKSTAKIFEFGCSEGIMLRHFINQGYKAFGCEVNPEIAECAISELQVPIINKPIEKLNIAPNSIDRILSYHTLEHLIQPRKAIEICSNLLKPDGKIFINIPVDDGEFGNLDHYQFFSVESINYLLSLYFKDINYKVSSYITANGCRFGGIVIYATKK